MNKTLSDVEIKDATKGQVTAVFSTFNVVDSDGDVTLPDAIEDGKSVVISAYGHQSWKGMLPVGKGVIRKTDTQALLEGQFFMDTVAGKETFAVVKALGPMGEWSYSLENVKSKSGELDGQKVNFLESIEVHEVSPVLRGAGIGTQTLVAKGLLSLQEQIAEAVDVVKQAIDGAERVVALRAEKGKALSKVNAEGLAGLLVEMDRLKGLLDTEDDTTPASADEVPDDIKALAQEHLRADLFSSLTRNGAHAS